MSCITLSLFVHRLVRETRFSRDKHLGTEGVHTNRSTCHVMIYLPQRPKQKRMLICWYSSWILSGCSWYCFVKNISGSSGDDLWSNLLTEIWHDFWSEFRTANGTQHNRVTTLPGSRPTKLQAQQLQHQRWSQLRPETA
jgi:hypothetical protein